MVHSILPAPLTDVVDGVLARAGVPHTPHGEADPAGGAEQAAADAEALAVIGPLRSAAVAEAVEATAPAGLALIAPFATWVGVTRDDEPGCDDPAAHDGTVLRLVARDSEVARRLAADLRASGRTALVVAGGHDYGRQLESQLRMAGLPGTEDASAADVVVLAGLAGEAEIAQAAELAPLPVVAFDGVQGADLGAERDVQVLLPYADDAAAGGRVALEPGARRAAELVAAALAGGAADRRAVLDALRRLGPFDEHGDPVDPPVWLWRADASWALTPERALTVADRGSPPR